MNKLAIAIFVVAFTAVFAATTTKHPQQKHKGRGKCIIAPAATTNCSGVTGTKCKNETNLLSLVKSNQMTVLVCQGKVQVPKSKNITVALSLKPCKVCPCFIVPDAETRLCKDLNADATFVKNSCSDQAFLISLLATVNKVKICVAARNGTSFVETKAKIQARLR